MNIETFTGRYFDYAAPAAEDVSVTDIARALSHTCRFGGHTSRFYSVAEHAVLVRWLVRRSVEAPELWLAALHHDSHEAYVGDIPTPLKHHLGQPYREMRHAIDVAVGERLGIHPDNFENDHIRKADALALRIEAGVLKTSGGVGEHWGHTMQPPAPPWILGMSPGAAEAAFLHCHRDDIQ
jgi:hypothetical protein